MRRLASFALTILNLSTMPTLACGLSKVDGTAKAPIAQVQQDAKSQAQAAAAEKREDAKMLAQGYVKAYTRCGRDHHIWIKLPKAGAPGA